MPPVYGTFANYAGDWLDYVWLLSKENHFPRDSFLGDFKTYFSFEVFRSIMYADWIYK